MKYTWMLILLLITPFLFAEGYYTLQFVEEPLFTQKRSRVSVQSIQKYAIESRQDQIEELVRRKRLKNRITVQNYTPPKKLSYLISGISLYLTAEELEEIKTLPFIKRIEPVQKVSVSWDLSADYASPLSVSDFVKAKQVWSDETLKDSEGRLLDGTGIVIGIVDTGVNYNHVAFAGKYLGGKDFADEDDDPMDRHGHGTHVAGIALSAMNGMYGMAPGAKLKAYKVLKDDGTGNSDVIQQAVEWIARPENNQGVHILNLSLGTNDVGDPNSIMAQACNNAMEEGIVVVIAAGNSGVINDPACAEKAITVGNMESEYKMATNSGEGPVVDSVKGITFNKPDLVAPGTDIYSSWIRSSTDIVSQTGTSMASPVVAGCAALLKQRFPTLSAFEIKQILMDNADSLSGIPITKQGKGLVNIQKALQNYISIYIPFQIDNIIFSPQIPYQDAETEFQIQGKGFTEATKLTIQDYSIGLSSNKKVDIPDAPYNGASGGKVSIPIFVPLNETVEIMYASCKATHPNTYDLKMYLEAPDGSSFQFYPPNPLDEQSDINFFVINSEITNFNGYNSYGTWKFVAEDVISGNIGFLEQFALKINEPLIITSEANFVVSGEDIRTVFTPQSFGNYKLRALSGERIADYNFDVNPFIAITIETGNEFLVDITATNLLNSAETVEVYTMNGEKVAETKNNNKVFWNTYGIVDGTYTVLTTSKDLSGRKNGFNRDITLSRDSDDDQMPDVWENSYGINFTKLGDVDGDGLLNYLEYFYGTNPLNYDTDGGGQSDGSEYAQINKGITKNAISIQSDDLGKGDVNSDGTVDVFDIMTIVQKWGITAEEVHNRIYDIDKDGKITIIDVMAVVNEWGKW